MSELIEAEATPSWPLLSPPWAGEAPRSAAEYFLGVAGLGLAVIARPMARVAAAFSERKAVEAPSGPPRQEVRLARRGRRASPSRHAHLLPPMPAWDDAVAAIAAEPGLMLPVLRGQTRPTGTNVALVLIRADLDAPSAADEAGAAAHALTLAALNAEAASLVSLQGRQKLSSQALSFAGQREQGVLSLFR